MQFSDVSIPEVYKESSDFRVLLQWFAQCLTRIKFDHENMFDLYDPLRCPDKLLWMLADTMGFKYDSRLPTSFNRLVLLYFMSMIRNRGSNDGVTLAAETNLAQFNLDMVANQGYEDESGNWVEPKDILNNRLEDTSIPVNSVYVTPHVEEGYIDVVYFSTKLPIDACIEYVRPLGMYLFQTAGVRLDARTKVSVDARLTNLNDLNISIGPTHVGHYRREDYARLQKVLNQNIPEGGNSMSGYTVKPKYVTDKEEYLDPSTGTKKTRIVIRSVEYNIAGPDGTAIPGLVFGTEAEALAEIPKYSQVDLAHIRNSVYYRNSKYEKEPNEEINPGYRTLYSLQLANNEQIVKSLLDPYFSLGYGPQDVDVTYPDSYLKDGYVDKPETNQSTQPATMAWNLRYNRDYEEKVVEGDSDKPQAYTVDADRTKSIIEPRPAVNPIAAKLGDAISMHQSLDTNTNTYKDDNTIYTKVVTNDDKDEIHSYNIQTGQRVTGYDENGDPIYE